MRFGILGNAGSWYVADLERATDELGHTAVRLEFPRLTASVAIGGAPLRAEPGDIAGFDALIVRTMPPGTLEQVVFRMDALARAEAAGVTVFNPPKAIECAVDKYLTTWRLERAGLPVPATVVCEDSESALEAFATLGGDVVLKPIFGSEGRGLCRVSDPDIAFRAFRTLERLGAVLYLQRFVEHAGSDVRVLVLDGRVLGAIRRHSNGDFRTNVSHGGRAEPHEVTGQEAEWSVRAADVVGARFAGVDILHDAAGAGHVIEVNAVPGWRAFARATGIDVARRVLQSIEVSGGRQGAVDSCLV